MRPVLCLLVCLACSPRLSRYVFLPKTVEVRKCQRECMQVEATCRTGLRSVDKETRLSDVISETPPGDRCGDQEQDCLVTCPGAVEVFATSADEARRQFAKTPHVPPPLVTGTFEDFAYSRDAGAR